ncbi:hypothetical protein [Streptococcus parasanguinis]|uniref:hypothetical protein n=1 Tax=Streptococcus parasanguinis TaxID=1318 RepID=UPI00352C0B0E
MPFLILISEHWGIKLLNRGSEFRKWDLHIHSPYTMVNNQFGLLDGDGKIDEDRFIKKIKESNLSKIEKFKNRKNELDRESIDIKNKIILKYKDYSKYREDLLSSFKIEDDDSLKISIEFNLKDLEMEFDYISARGRSKQDFLDKLTNSFDEVIDSIFEDDNLTFNGNRNKLNHIEHFFTTNFYDYQFEIEYQGDKFDQMSPGKKAFIVFLFF